MRHQPSLQLRILTGFLLVCALAWSTASAADPPAAVNQLIIAMDGWGSDLIDPGNSRNQALSPTISTSASSPVTKHESAAAVGGRMVPERPGH